MTHTTTAEVKHIVAPFAIKADSIDDGSRTFEGLASVWGLDLGDDVMHRGAFKDTIAEWRKSGDAIPLLNSHNHWDVLSAVGQLLDAKETADGLWTKWEVIDGADGDAVLARLRPSTRTGRSPVSKMSIGYEPAKYDMEESEAAQYGMIRNLRKVNLKEVSLVIFPMAPGARINAQSVKSFLDAATATDPQTVSDDETRLALRRLASRIGILLAPVKSATSADTTTDGDDTPDGDPPADPPADDTGGSGTDAETKADEPEYLYAEALQQRLLRIRNHTLIHNTGAIQ